MQGVNLADCISTSQVSTVSIAASLCAEGDCCKGTFTGLYSDIFSQDIVCITGGLESVIQKVTQLCQETSAPQRKGVCVFVDSLTVSAALISRHHGASGIACLNSTPYTCICDSSVNSARC